MSNKNDKVVVGKRQILRGIKDGIIAEIIIAGDAEKAYIQSLIIEAQANKIKYAIKGSMQEISRTFGIDVPSGSVGILKD